MAFADERNRAFSGGSPIRSVAPSTRSALTGRISPGGALSYAGRLNTGFRELANRIGASQAPQTGYTPNDGSWVGTFQTNPNANYRNETLNPRSPTYVDPTRPASDSSASIRERINTFAENYLAAAPSGVGDLDLGAVIQDEISRNMAAREAAIADGQAEAAAEYDKIIAELREQQAKLKVGRDTINAEYGSVQAQMEAQQADLKAAEIGATGTDIGGEVVAISDIYDQGNVELNSFLNKIGADNPALASQLGSDMMQFQALAEQRLRSDLGNQASITRAAGLFAQKAGESLISLGRVEAEQGRLQIEGEITKQIQSLADRIKDAQDQKSSAMDQIRDSVGDYDVDWVNNPEAVWEVFEEKWLAGRDDLNFEERAALSAHAREIYDGLDDKSREGALAWARGNLRDTNKDQVFYKLFGEDTELWNEAGLSLRIATLAQQAGQSMSPEELSNFLVRLDLESSTGNASPLGSVVPFLHDLGIDIEFTALDDYAELVDWIELRNNFVETDYEEFRDETLAMAAGSGASASSVDGSQFTRDDMARVTSGGSVGFIHPGAADSFTAMVAEAKADGVNLGFSDTYRSWAFQNTTYQNFINPAHKNYGRNSNGVLVDNIAKPNSSLHPKGLAIDFTISDGDAGHEWLKANGIRFGWFGISNEVHHWEYRGGVSAPEEPESGRSPTGGPY